MNVIISSEDGRKEFMALRHKSKKRIEKADFLEKEEIMIDIFNDMCLLSTKNDAIAQDYLAYIFKKGFGEVIPVNYEKYMQFEILAGANGNNFVIDKLNLFLNFALNEILYVEDFPYIASKNGITSRNFNYVVGRLICVGIADELRLDAEKLVKSPIEHKEFTASVMRDFDKARSASIPKVLKFLRS